MVPLSEARVDSWSDSLTPCWLQERLPHYLWPEDDHRGQVVQVRIVQKRATSDANVGSLVLAVIRQHDGTLLEQMYICSTCTDDELCVKYEEWISTATILPSVGPAVIPMPEANLLLVAFPNDREMRLLTEADLKRWLADHATTLANAGGRYPRWRLKALTVRLLRYAPGERLTTGCRGVFESEDGVQQPFAYIAKQLGKKRRARPLYRNLRSLGHHLSGSPTVRLPRAIAVDDETGLVMMEELPGKELKRSLHEVDVDAVMRALGEMLATFHQVPRRVRQTISVQNELHDVNRAASAIRSVVPSVASRVDACVARCRAMRWTDGTPNVLLHGACRLKHVFIHDGRLALVDVDGIRMGHPGYDLGHFLSSLYYLEAQEAITPAVRETCARRVLEGYAARAPWQVSPVSVLWFVAALLIHKQARKYALHLHDDRREKIDRVLTLAETALAGCEGLRRESSLEAVCHAMRGSRRYEGTSAPAQ